MKSFSTTPYSDRDSIKGSSKQFFSETTVQMPHMVVADEALTLYRNLMNHETLFRRIAYRE